MSNMQMRSICDQVTFDFVRVINSQHYTTLHYITLHLHETNPGIEVAELVSTFRDGRLQLLVLFFVVDSLHVGARRVRSKLLNLCTKSNNGTMEQEKRGLDSNNYALTASRTGTV